MWKDTDTFLRFGTSSISGHEFSLHGWLNMIWQISGRGYLEETQDGSVYLRLERSGDQISAYCSGDGKNWFTCGNLEFPSGDPIQVGIYAIGAIDRTVYCGSYKDGTATLFRNFRIWTK